MDLWRWISSNSNVLLFIVLSANVLLTLFVSKASRATKVLLVAVMLVPVVGAAIVFGVWRMGHVVAEAEFNPGIAPFHLTVRRVPVPVTHSSHFIVELKRGQYVVTSFRYFWPEYTPERVKIGWDKIEHFTVTFDDAYVASCDWSWGKEATWRMVGPPDGKTAGLSATYFTPVDENARAEIWP